MFTIPPGWDTVKLEHVKCWHPYVEQASTSDPRCGVRQDRNTRPLGCAVLGLGVLMVRRASVGRWAAGGPVPWESGCSVCAIPCTVAWIALRPGCDALLALAMVCCCAFFALVRAHSMPWAIPGAGCSVGPGCRSVTLFILCPPPAGCEVW